MASLIFNWKLVETESRVLKQFYEQREGQFSEPLRCLKMWECLSRRDVHVDAIGDVSVGFTNITGTTTCTRELRNNLRS